MKSVSSFSSIDKKRLYVLEIVNRVCTYVNWGKGVQKSKRIKKNWQKESNGAMTPIDVLCPVTNLVNKSEII